MNEQRSVEEALALRLEGLRGNRSYQTLSKEVEAATGKKIAPSTLHKIERGEPRRKISVDDLVTFSNFYNVPVIELLQPELSAVSPANAGEGSSELRGTVDELRGILQTMLKRYSAERKTLDDLSSVVRSLRALEGKRPDSGSDLGSFSENSPEDELMFEDEEFRASIVQSALDDTLRNASGITADVRKYLEGWRNWLEEQR